MSVLKPQFTSVKVALAGITALHNKCSRLPELLGYSSQDISLNFRRLITRCNSLSVVFLQYKLHREVLSLLKTAAAADIGLCEYGGLFDRLWPGRLVSHNIRSFYFQQ
jgi:hypothetical protein